MRVRTLSFFLFRHSRLLFLFVLTLLCSGCAVNNEYGQAINQTANISLEAGHSIGQSFTAYFNGLDKIEVYLTPASPGSGTLQFELYSGGQVIATATQILSLTDITGPGYYRFDFQPITQSNKQAYEFSLNLLGEGSLTLGSAPSESYQEGTMYRDHNPFDAQLSFRLGYDSGLVGLGLAREVLSWLKWVLLALFLFLIPGAALFSGFLPGYGLLTIWEQIGLACGVGIAIYPLLMLWSDLVGVKFGIGYALIPASISMGFLLWKGFRFGFKTKLKFLRELKIELLDILIGITVIIIFCIRFYAIRTIDYPMWGDSYQHTLITQLIVENGGLFNSWQPYADLQTFTYHFGFHASAAVFDWLGGMTTARAVLVMGQILNCFAILALIPLTMKVCNRSKLAGLITILVAGVLSPMPMTYTDWGRYTQLAGQVILPVVVWSVWRSLEEKQFRPLILSILLWGGLALTHYRVLIFGVLFIVPIVFQSFLNHSWKTTLPRILIQGIGGGLLFLPWLLHVTQGNIFNLFNNSISTPASALTDVALASNAVPAFTDFLPVWMLVLSFLAILFMIWRKNSFGITFIGWWLLIVLAANPNWLGLPGLGLLSNFAVVIAGYILVSVLIGSLSVELQFYNRLPSKLVWAVFIPILGILLTAGFAWRLGDITIQSTAMVTGPDQRAALWIQQSTPPDARFLVNNFPAFFDTAIVGSDAGWWLPYTARRQTNLPPLNYTTEKGSRPDYIFWINEVNKIVTANGLDSPATLDLLNNRGIHYVYVGQENGRVNYGGPAFLDLSILNSSQHYKVVYHADRVWIFEIIF
jgi:hypothetical protein